MRVSSAWIFVLTFFVGASLTSFFNLFFERRDKGEDWIAKSSYCEGCRKKLSFVARLPIIGYILEKGHCACGYKIPLRHLLTELFGGSVFIMSLYTYAGLGYPIYFFAMAGMLLLTLEDCRYKEVHTISLFVTMGLWLLYLWIAASFNLLSGLFIGVLLSAIYFLFPKGFGEGDIYYGAMLAFGFQSIWHSYLFFTLSFTLAAAIGIVLWYFRVVRHRQIPMYPFFLLSYFLTHIIFI